ncbi:hypothetical protein GWN42_17225 [candidate division KSB1 bacterium]|nr:V-type ATP synthase subunit I [Phycisphaerae bacterium]NIV94479.1 hypothetical protein [candidate division KSB1 bacterium]
MNVEMVPIEIIGLKTDLQPTIHTLRKMACVQIEDLTESPQVSARPLTLDRETLQNQENLNFLVAKLEGLLDTFDKKTTRTKHIPPLEKCLDEAKQGVDILMPKVQELISARDELQAELSSLPRYKVMLRKLLPIVPQSAHDPKNVTVGILVSRSHLSVLDSVGKQILDITRGLAEIIASDIDASTRAMLISFPEKFTEEIETILGQKDVSRLRLPKKLGSGPPDVILSKLNQRIANIPEEIKEIDSQLAALANQWCDKLAIWRDVLRDALDANSVLSNFGETDMTFVLVGWVPEKDFETVVSGLRETIGDPILVRKLTFTPDMRKRAPIALHNPQPARPFESLVNLLALPRYGHIDPTKLMAFFLPIFFGMILGDVGYGVLLLSLCLGLLRKFKYGIVRDIITVLAIGSGWAIIFGFLYGEVFGTLGEHLGMHAIWLDRGSAEYVGSLLLMTLAVGAVHITLGLLLGIWEAFTERNRNHLLERGGMLIGLVSLFLLVGQLANILPIEFRTPAVGGLLIGITLLGVPLGWLGILMGPIEFIGLIGNILSYLRIAAIGLASVYLAKVANDMAGMLGNVVVGAILAILIHALNLVLGAFSPTIHSLRLHYVEFFRKFYEGGGRPYKPFRSQIGLDR